MSSDYYFTKWRETLQRLEELIKLDQEFQKSKIHDKKRCDAVVRLCGVMGEYIVIYNAAFECWQQNLQVQKTAYMCDVIKAITNRILELKHDIRKLEYSDTQFLGHGLAHHKLTTYDAELEDVPTHIKRLVHVDAAIAEAFRKAEEKRELLRIKQEAKYNSEEKETVKEKCWWDEDDMDGDDASTEPEEEPETEEIVQTRQMATLIQAHIRSRNTIQSLTQSHQQREKWEKELNGTLKPPARLELRERGAKIIQKTLRAFFEIKRKKIIECKQDEILGIRLCRKIENKAINSANEIKRQRTYQREHFEHQWMDFKEKLKEDYKKRKAEDIADDYRDFINGWFLKWFDDVKYFYDIPKDIEGGSLLIMKEDVPEPIEWWENYKLYLEEKKANKNKSSQQLKFEKEQAKREEQMQKKEELIKKRLEEKMAKRLMKNPNMHPGFNYPESKRTEHILETIEHYKKDWDDLDRTGNLEVKKKFVSTLDINEIYAEIKTDLMHSVDKEMRNEMKILKKALKNDYKNSDEPYPEVKKERHKPAKQQKIVKSKISENIAEKLEDLAFKDILKEYPQTKLSDFLGDHNFAGDDMRCNYEPAPHFSGETRALWWERCREATHGFHKILVVGPPLSGKTVLVHALATVTDAVLFELDASNIRSQSSSTADLSRLLNSVAACARAAQPSVIYIKHVHRLFYNKIPPEEANINLNQIKRFVTKMIKKFNKTDKVAVIGTCVDPWLTKSSSLSKEFPVVVLVPDTSYSAVFRMLNHWMSENRFLPRDLDIHSLAYALRGYSYGYLEETLRNFLSAEEIIRIAARGISLAEIYDYFLKKDTEKVDFEKYIKWYAEKTPWGKKEAKHIEEQREFKRVFEKYAEIERKKKKMELATNSETFLESGSSDITD